MKPLTIDELKALEVGDWVWIVKGNIKCYFRKDYSYGNEERFMLELDEHVLYDEEFLYSEYGKTWVAYRNKQEAEANGEIVELPCIREVKGANYVRYNIYFIRTTAPDIGAIDFYTVKDKPEAERRLAELKG